MSKVQRLILISIGFPIFEILLIRLGFFIGITINRWTLIASLMGYVIFVGLFITIVRTTFKEKLLNFLCLFVFILAFGILALSSLLLSNTYDTSWDGQGYHQTAVIALTEGWNPVSTPTIPFKLVLPSQIFAEGYPSALWEIQASVYSLVGRINSAKVVNVAIALIAFLSVFELLRKLSLNKIFSLFVSLLVVLQPVYIVQALTFMQDGFGYELLVVAASSLILFIINKKNYASLLVFIFSTVFLVSTKYSQLPVALLFGFVFVPVVVNRFFNKDYVFNFHFWSFVTTIAAICLIFAWVPYVRNFVFHSAPFYPTNISELSGSVRYNNLPNNLKDKDNFTLFLYGIFSKSQNIASGDPRSTENVAELKIPFTFSNQEFVESGQIFNNRVGASGPLFSGIVLASMGLLIFTSFRAQTEKQKYGIYSIWFIEGIIVVTSLLVPTPNLVRYVSQVELIPLVIIAPVYILFKEKSIRMFSVLVSLLIFANSALYTIPVFIRNQTETKRANQQFLEMSTSSLKYEVKAQQFYSSYILLTEHGVNFLAVNKLACRNVGFLVSSSDTTEYCILDNTRTVM